MEKIRSVTADARVRATMFVLTVLGLGVAPAYASTTTDPLDGGGDAIFTTLTDYLTGSLVAKVFALAVVSIAIGLVLRWVRKAVHA
jgi:hypothetical protein